MKSVIRHCFTFASLIVFCGGCVTFEQPVAMSGEEIVFGADAHIVAETKATSGTAETTSLTSFYVSAVTGSAGSESSAFTSTQFTQIPGSSPAAYKGSRNWPASDQNYKFYASNVPLTFAAGGTTVSATNTTDVVCAYLTDGTYKTKNTLTFDHIFARLGRVDVVAETGYTISGISIRMTPKTGGTYNLRTGAGQTDGTGWSSVTTGSSTVVANKTGANANDVYLVPGSYTLTATWTATQSGASVTYTNMEVDIVVVGGKTNVVSVVLGGEIILGIDLEEYCEYNYKDNLDYLTFYCDEAGTIGWKCTNASVAKTIQYSKDQGATWTSITSTTSGATISVSAGDVVWFKGTNSAYGTATNYNSFTLSNNAHVYGNVNSLTGNNVSVDTYCFYALFRDCAKLNTYNIKKIILPATTLSGHCYKYMFANCFGLTSAPDLPATTMKDYCYLDMFYQCTSLTIAPKLPATTLASCCYSNMFAMCSGLETAPDLPATTLAPNCYESMFKGCSGLLVAPELPATTLAAECYYSMFSLCSNLTTAPVLAVMTLANNCYGYMFYNCTGLLTAPELPATTLANYCYANMFKGCTGITVAPELPATTLANYCYANMFQGCTGLTTAPELPAVTLAGNCYSSMFYGCSSLNYVKALFTTTPSDTYTQDWVNGVAATGTFVKNPDAAWSVVGNNGVPTGWTVFDKNYLKFTFTSDGSVAWQNVKGDIQYSKNNGPWTAFGGATVSVSAGDEILFKGALTNGVGNAYEHTSSKFITTGKFNVSGDVRSLSSFSNTIKSRHFAYLFSKCFGLESAEDLVLPSASLNSYCFSSMFQHCVSLTVAPELPAASLATQCYYSMFEGCTSLESAPNLPATTLATGCYYAMFKGCSSLRAAPELPVQTLQAQCYYSMFEKCVSLTEAPELPATTMQSSCYQSMFLGCTALTEAPELPATTLATSCYYSMFNGCQQLATAPDLPATALATSCYYGMFQGCLSLTTAPVLPAETLVSSCYINMFNGCSSLNYIKALFTTTPSDTYTKTWVKSVAASGTFVKNFSAAWTETGNNGVPTGWMVEYTYPEPVGKFTINASGDQVGFAPGNLQCTIASGPDATGYNYTGTNWTFAKNQWEYLGSTASANSFVIGTKMDLFGWVGETADYNTYGLVNLSSTYSEHYGNSSDDVLKTDWGSIAELISNCGSGWYSLSIDDWDYILNSRSGGTVNSSTTIRYTGATIRTDAGGEDGFIIFPDNCMISGSEFTTVGRLNGNSNWGPKCTASQWTALEKKGCVFIPLSGYGFEDLTDEGGDVGYYCSSSARFPGLAWYAHFENDDFDPEHSKSRCFRMAVRLVKRVN